MTSSNSIVQNAINASNGIARNATDEVSYLARTAANKVEEYEVRGKEKIKSAIDQAVYMLTNSPGFDVRVVMRLRMDIEEHKSEIADAQKLIARLTAVEKHLNQAVAALQRIK